MHPRAVGIHHHRFLFPKQIDRIRGSAGNVGNEVSERPPLVVYVCICVHGINLAMNYGTAGARFRGTKNVSETLKLCSIV